MIFSNQIINAKGTPSFYEDTLANRPAASTIGRLFVRTDNPYGIYRDQGTSWQLITGSGGGGSQNWDNVLSLGGAFTSNRLADFNNYNLNFNNVNNFRVGYTSNSYVNLSSNLFYFYDNSISLNNVFEINYSDSIAVLLGDFQAKNNHTSINLYDDDFLIYTTGLYGSLGIKLDFFSNNFLIGDYENTINAVYLNVDVNNQIIKTYNNDRGIFGLNVQFNDWVTILGDSSDLGQASRITIDNRYESDNIYTSSLDGVVGLKFYFDGFSSLFMFGDFNNLLNIPSIIMYGDTFELSESTFETGLKIRYNVSGFVQQAFIGDYSSSTNSFCMVVQNSKTSSTSNAIFTANTAFVYGIYTNLGTKENYLGDWGNHFGESSVKLTANDFQIDRVDNLKLNGTGIISGSSGSTTTQHLVVYINGTQYKIQLRNP